MLKVTCQVYTCTEAYTGQAIFNKVQKTRPCLTGHPVPGAWPAAEGELRPEPRARRGEASQHDALERGQAESH